MLAYATLFSHFISSSFTMILTLFFCAWSTEIKIEMEYERRRNCGQDVIEKWVNVRASLRNEKKRFLVEYPKFYKISFPARYQYFFTYMCVSQGKNMKWILIAIITLLSRTRLEAASSEEVIDIRALNNLSNVKIGNKIFIEQGSITS